MTELARWKTIATIAIAFSAGNLFATACDTSGGDTAHASGASDGENPPSAALQAEVALLRSEVNSLICFIEQMTDNQAYSARDTDETSHWATITWDDHTDGAIAWEQGMNSDSSQAYDACF